MAGETIITVVGNLTADPELRSTKNGRSVAGFTIASTPRTFDRQSNQWVDCDALFLRCTVWGDPARHCAQSLSKGMRVIAQGRLTQRSYQAQDGSNRTVIELQVDEIGPSLRYATAQVSRTGHRQADGTYGNPHAAPPVVNTSTGGWSQRPQQPAQPPADDPWATPPADQSSFGGSGTTGEPDF